MGVYCIKNEDCPHECEQIDIIPWQANDYCNKCHHFINSGKRRYMELVKKGVIKPEDEY